MSPYSTPDPADPLDPSQDLGDTVDISDAARQLGISEAAVKLAIERGFLRGYYQEISGRWRVRLEYTGSAAPRTPPRADPLTPSSPPLSRPEPPSPPPEPPPAFQPHASGLAHAPITTTAPREPTRPRAAAAPATPGVLPAAAPPVTTLTPATAGPSPQNDLARTVETVLREQIAYLRDQLDRREASLREKDAAVAELVQQLTKFARRALPPPPPAESDGLRVEFDRYRQVQHDVLERHESAIANIGETLGLVRDHLILLKPRDERGPRR